MQIAMGELRVEDCAAPVRKASEDDNMDYKAAYDEAQATIHKLESRIAELELMFANRGTPALAPAHSKTVRATSQHSAAPDDEVAMSLEVKRPVIDVTVRKYVIEADDSTLRGKLAVLISQNFFDQGPSGNAAYNELQRRGFSTAKPNVYRELDKLAVMGFLTKEASGGYHSVPGMKVNVKEVSEVA